MQRPLRWFGAALLCTTLVTACGSDVDDEETPNPENQTEVDGGDTPDDTRSTDGGTTTGGGTEGNQEPDTPGEMGTTQSTARGAGG